MSAPSQAEAKAIIDLANKLAADSISGFWSSGAVIIQQIIESGAESIWAPLAKNMAEPLRGILDDMVASGILENDDAVHLKSVLGKDSGVNWLVQWFAAMALWGEWVSSLISVPAMKASQGVLKKLRPQLPYVSEIIAAAFIAPEKTGEVREILARSGYSEDAIDLLFLGKYRAYEEFQIQQLWLRKEISDSKMYERMRELGYTDTRIGELTKLWTIIPPVQDILTMVAKEAFEPDTVSQLGLSAEFPVEQSEWLTKMGLSEYWQHKYWAAHWDQPSIQQGYEMLHRGVIDNDTLQMLFRTVEIPTYWRDKLTKIAYQPYTRVDVRRMYDMGVLGEEELKKAYTDIGYDEEHATGMTEFTKRYVEDADRDLTKGEILKGYRNALLSRGDAIALLTDIRYTDAQAAYYIELEDYRELEAIQSAAIATIKTKYLERLIDRGQAQSMLDALNLPAAQVNLWLERWDVSLIEYPKLPSKTDLDKFYIAGVIGSDQYNIEMQRLGYGHIYIGWYKKMADAIKGRAS
jgi:hypothetical protein